MSAGRILAIDDEQNIRHLISNELSLEGFEVVTAKTGEEGLRLVEKKQFDLVLLDIRLPKMNGIEVLKRLKPRYPQLKVIMITAYGDIQTAVESMKLGAVDYITKPFKLVELIALLKQILGASPVAAPAEIGSQVPAAANSAFVRCPSQAMQEIYGLLERVAQTDKTVLIQGETGVGKDVIARLIHDLSPRASGPFVVVDCGTLNQNLAESELYGHIKGAFSGATERKSGLVEKSHGGSLFLDEIGNIELELQKKFLRFLETKHVRRLGETRESYVDTRIILATNLDLQEAVHRGSMRHDLFYRMSVFHIHIPPLRKRQEDIPVLARHFLSLDKTMHGPTKISPEALATLAGYSWPGNVRELRAVINKAMIYATSDTITPADLPSELRRVVPIVSPKTLEDMEREYILTVLERTGGNQSEAAKILGINRKTLYKKIHKFQILT
ncbi:MAG: sigma-54-dependent transcriptional regulator [Desulfobacca sp.]|uniref:sigma-54-dependent transcriptional regulator n=1 Tax=Desulfobacca sp. TaxID=2067990 RepID=UPI00404A4303